jgi:hypothetical protein
VSRKPLALAAPGDVHCYGPVTQEDIVDIWQPGHRDYDRHDLRVAKRRTR